MKDCDDHCVVFITIGAFSGFLLLVGLIGSVLDLFGNDEDENEKNEVENNC
jgi:hypothetical protein